MKLPVEVDGDYETSNEFAEAIVRHCAKVVKDDLTKCGAANLGECASEIILREFHITAALPGN